MLIHDECHWGAEKKGKAAEKLNSDEFLKAENIFVVHVSATALNHLIIPEIKRNQIVDWKKVLENHQVRGKDNKMIKKPIVSQQ